MQATDALARRINKVIRGCSAQRSNSFLLFFDRKGTPLVYLLLTNETSFT